MVPYLGAGHSFATWLDSLFPRLVYWLREDTYMPLLAKGLGLGSAVVQGKVRNVAKAADIQAIQEGDIVVCDTIRLIQSCGRGKIDLAAAVITDSTGEMEQLSQFSCELNIPCVGGTVYATQLLHSGLQVLVDATGGLVHGIYQQAGNNDI